MTESITRCPWLKEGTKAVEWWPQRWANMPLNANTLLNELFFEEHRESIQVHGFALGGRGFVEEYVAARFDLFDKVGRITTFSQK